MRDKADKTASPGRRIGIGDIASYGLIIGTVLLGWQIVLQPLKQRAPVEVVIGLAPGSPLVLRRAAESELAAGRIDNAAALSRDALVRSPFDVRALRVLGLTEARAGREDRADEILTLAGNWSLRDDPAHAWLVERRLRRGDYASAFAHADTLVRRRQDIQPQVFRLFTVASTQDPERAVRVVANLLAARPPWRDAYLSGLTQTAEELQLSVTLAVLLEAGRAPLTNEELHRVYWSLLRQGQLEAIGAVRRQLNRPPSSALVTNGGFADGTPPEPFQWRVFQKAGIGAEIVADDVRPADSALRVDYDGFATGLVAEQLTTLPPGAYRFSTEIRAETDYPEARLVWTLTCANRESPSASIPVRAPGAAPNSWTTLSVRFEIPNACAAQWLRLETRGDDRRSPTVVWFDRVAISPAG